MRGIFKLYVPAKGFGWAIFFMFVTLVLVCYGVVEDDVLVLVLSLVSGGVGLYFTKKSWVSYRVGNKANKRKR